MTIANMIRLFCDEFEVIVPSKAHSTATLICLGADRVVMTKQATLGPIDPGINDPPNPPSIDSIIRRLVKVGARVVYHARKWHAHVAPVFSLARCYLASYSPEASRRAGNKAVNCVERAES